MKMNSAIATRAQTVYDRCKQAEPLIAIGGPVVGWASADASSYHAETEGKGVRKHMAGIAQKGEAVREESACCLCEDITPVMTKACYQPFFRRQVHGFSIGYNIS